MNTAWTILVRPCPRPVRVLSWAAMKRAMKLGGAGVAAVAILIVAFVVTRDEPQHQAVATPTIVATTVATAPPSTTTAVPDTTTSTTTPPTDEATPVDEPYDPAHPGPRPVPHSDGPRFPTIVATATKSVVPVYSAPVGGYVLEDLTSPLPYSGAMVNFKVLDVPGNGMLHVMLRTRPNGSTGYVSRRDVILKTIDWSIDVDVSAHYVTVYQGKNVFLETYAVTGTGGTPTPIGDFFVTEGVKESNPSGAHGVFIFGTSAHSDVWHTFGGGDGQIGIHGTNAPGLVGTGSSNGCIRLTNEAISRLAASMPLGTPIHIHR